MNEMIFSGTAIATTQDWVTETQITSFTVEPTPISLIVTDAEPARRSLREKAQGEMSGFDREYPW